MEDELFSYEGWDGELECLILYKPVLKIKIGDFEPGTKFSLATIMIRDGYKFMQLDNTDDEGKSVFSKAFKLHYVVGEEVKTENFV